MPMRLPPHDGGVFGQFSLIALVGSVFHELPGVFHAVSSARALCVVALGI